MLLAFAVALLLKHLTEAAPLPARSDYPSAISLSSRDDSTTVDGARLEHRHPVTPYAGRRLDGVVRSTWLRGRPVDRHSEPHGRFLTRGAA